MNCIAPKVITVNDGHAFRCKERVVSVPCMKCIPCLMNKRADWSFRLEQEHKVSKSALFVTLTYDQKHYPSDGSLDKRHLQLYLKRCRKLDKKINGSTRIRYFAVGEYGSRSGRAHYHLLMFNISEDIVRKCWTDIRGRSIGLVHVGRVTAASVAYVTKYVVQTDASANWRSKNNPFGLLKPFSLMSRAYGIGAHYLTDEMVHWHKSNDRNYAMREGAKVRLPRFYRTKIWYHPEDRDRVSKSSMQLSLTKREKEIQWYRKRYGSRAEKVMTDSRDAVLARVRVKVAFSQKM